MNSKNRVVLCQLWEESEKGWGVRPDGYSLHLKMVDRNNYIKEYWTNMPDATPSEYSRPCGEPYACSISEELFQELYLGKTIRRYDSTPQRFGS